MLLQLQKFSLNVYYKPGRELDIADALSRDYPEEQFDNEEIFPQNDDHIFKIFTEISNQSEKENLLIKNETYKIIENATLASKEM